jgi:hypothetical protein
MKRIITICASILMTASVFAQAPEKMSYQAIVRDGSNNLVSSTSVGMQISILQGSGSGTAVYVETQTPTTNANGLVSIEIGGGTVVSGNFSTIDWANGPYFVKTETDPTGGTSYSITGTSQLLSVPYALHAKNTDSWIVNSDTTFSLRQVKIGTTYSNPSNNSLKIQQYNNTDEAIQILSSTSVPRLNIGTDNTGQNSNIISFNSFTFGTDGDNNNNSSSALNNFYWINNAYDINDPNAIEQMSLKGNGQLKIANSDVYINNIGSGVIMKSPNGNCWRVTVDNNGNFVSAPINCP